MAIKFYTAIGTYFALAKIDFLGLNHFFLQKIKKILILPVTKGCTVATNIKVRICE
jgi:hypothetical protein